MTPQLVFVVFSVFYFLHQSIETVLALLNHREMKKNQAAVPDFFRDHIDLATHQKSIAYNLEKSRFSLINDWVVAFILFGIILWGGFEKLEAVLSFLPAGSLHLSVAYCFAAGIGLFLLKLPSSLYSQFVIEEKYGFNKTTWKTFVSDMLKTLALSLALGGPLLYLIFWIFGVAGEWWWLWAFATMFGFEFLMAAIYPTFLAPIFNKFTPMPDGELKSAILAIAQKIQFKLSGIFTIDGSKRSSHSNAYFAGIGRFRRIVLFDTLQKQMTNQEIVAVLGHEMGHNKKKHIQKQLILSFLFSFTGFWVLSLLMTWPVFYDAFHAGATAPHKGIVLFSLFSGCFTFLLKPWTNYLSRKYEYESDKFSVEVTKDGASMKNALLKLTKENLSNLTPHPLYSFYHYSHPTTLERVRAIQEIA